MKYIQCIFTIILVLLLLFNGGVDILAVDMGFSTEPMSEDEIETFLKNVNISILENEPSKKAIDCFDVNENGEIAIGNSDFENKTVCVYTNDGDFIFGYSFECTGNFGIELDKDVINLYFFAVMSQSPLIPQVKLSVFVEFKTQPKTIPIGIIVFLQPNGESEIPNTRSKMT